MKKKMYVLGVAALVAALLAMSGVAQSAMWVGAEIGGNFNTGVNMEASALGASVSRNTFVQPIGDRRGDHRLRFRQCRLWGLCLARLDEIFQFCHGPYLQPAGHQRKFWNRGSF